jgi:predicted transcriptional regulator
MHDPKWKERAILLRKEGKSITSIANLYGLNKTTVSYWCRNVALTERLLQKLEVERKSAAAIALLRYGERNRANRIKKVKPRNYFSFQRIYNYYLRSGSFLDCSVIFGKLSGEFFEKDN